MQIRNMLQTDIKAVAELEKKCFSQPWSENSLKESLQNNSYDFLVAEEANKIIGYMGVTIILEEADVTNVAVDLDYRCQGVGTALIFHMLQLCRAKGVNAITLEVRSSNQAAIKLYEKMRFISVGVRKNFYEKPTEDAIIMWNYQL